MNEPTSPAGSQPGQHSMRKAPVVSVAAADTYITVKRAGSCAGTISFDPDDPGVSRFIARTADGQAAGLITSTGRSFRVETPGTTDWCAHWQAAAEAVFGPDVTVELT